MIHNIIATIFNLRKSNDADIRRWAEIEYKKDSEFAYNHIIYHGCTPDLKLNR
jgi:hypothetical protein